MHEELPPQYGYNDGHRFVHFQNSQISYNTGIMTLAYKIQKLKSNSKRWNGFDR